MPASLLEKVARQYLEHLEIEKNRSSHTIENYTFYIDRFLEWADARAIKAPASITLDVMREYRLWLNRLHQEKPLKKNTQNYHLIALRSFFKYLAKRDIRTLSPEKIELAKTQQRQVDFLEREELERFLECPDRCDEDLIIKRRDRAILELFFSTGLRVAELASLTRTMINFEKEEFTIRGKGERLRLVFISPRAKTHLANYLALRKDLLTPLFIRHDRAFNARTADEEQYTFSLTPRSIQRLVQKYALLAGVTKRITPHVMRHSFATDLLMNGADIRSVQALLGHASITTTQIYTHVTNQQLRDVHKAFHGRTRK